MATFMVYNTDDTNRSDAVLTNNQVVTVGLIETGVASKVAGSVFSDTTGTLQVQQCFDYWTSGGKVNPTPHFDVVDTIAVTGGTPAKIDLDVIAPVLQVVFTNSNAAQTHLRIFVRVFGVNRG